MDELADEMLAGMTKELVRANRRIAKLEAEIEQPSGLRETWAQNNIEYEQLYRALLTKTDGLREALKTQKAWIETMYRHGHILSGADSAINAIEYALRENQ